MPFPEELPNSTNATLNEIDSNAIIIRFGDGQCTEIQRSSIRDYIANLTALPDIKHKSKKHSLTQSVITLRRAQAAHNDHETERNTGPFSRDMRVATLPEMSGWVMVQEVSRVCVMYGLPGTGKSTMAHAIASKEDKNGRLGASFFFTRDKFDCRTAQKFFTTIAYQLCRYKEEFAQAIGDVLVTESGSAATTGTPQQQVEVLIVEPLRAITASSDRPILVVVDALDECDAPGAPAVIAGLRLMIQELRSFKLIITTRPQQRLKKDLATFGFYKVVNLTHDFS